MLIKQSVSKLEINFKSDVKNKLLGQLQSTGYKVNKKDSVEDVVRYYYDTLLREISNKPRQIEISNQLQAKQLTGNTKLALEKIFERAKTGNSLNRYLSKKILIPKYNDLLLYDWGIHHLHLGLTLDNLDPRFISRTNELLYVRVQESKLYCIDILSHDSVYGFAEKNLIQIIHENWPDLISSHIVIDNGSHIDLSSCDIHRLRESHVNTFVSTSDGTNYSPPGGGYASNGSSLNVTIKADMFLSKINSLENAIIQDEPSLRAQIMAAKGFKCPPTIKVRLQDWSETVLFAYEMKTKTHLSIPW